jgi:hypothetical protein
MTLSPTTRRDTTTGLATWSEPRRAKVGAGAGRAETTVNPMAAAAR